MLFTYVSYSGLCSILLVLSVPQLWCASSDEPPRGAAASSAAGAGDVKRHSQERPESPIFRIRIPAARSPKLGSPRTPERPRSQDLSQGPNSPTSQHVPKKLS
jgi:hypothetical protein